MLYLNYAKPIQGGNILNFFADSEKDLEEISNGKKFIANNGTDYGVPVDSSTVIITLPDKTKKTYMLSNGEWIEGVKEEPAFQEEYDVTSWGTSNECLRYFLARGGYDGGNNNQKWIEYLGFEVPYGTPMQRSGGYFTNSYIGEENAGESEWGKIIDRNKGMIHREFLKSGSMYRVRLYPKPMVSLDDNEDFGGFYQWVCRYKRLNEGEAYMANEDCELSDRELMDLSLDADSSDSKNPDILFKFGSDLEGGEFATSGTFCEWIMTKKECNYLLLEVVEIQ